MSSRTLARAAVVSVGFFALMTPASSALAAGSAPSHSQAPCTTEHTAERQAAEELKRAESRAEAARTEKEIAAHDRALLKNAAQAARAVANSTAALANVDTAHVARVKEAADRAEEAAENNDNEGTALATAQAAEAAYSLTESWMAAHEDAVAAEKAAEAAYGADRAKDVEATAQASADADEALQAARLKHIEATDTLNACLSE
jgi:hypothetical protein